MRLVWGGLEGEGKMDEMCLNCKKFKVENGETYHQSDCPYPGSNITTLGCKGFEPRGKG